MEMDEDILKTSESKLSDYLDELKTQKVEKQSILRNILWIVGMIFYALIMIIIFGISNVIGMIMFLVWLIILSYEPEE